MIKIVAPGKIKDKHLLALIEDYQKRINRYAKLEVIEVKDETITDNDSSDNIKNKEAQRILDKINPQDFVIVLDLKGEMIDSVSFAKRIDNYMAMGKNIVFVIGGSLGLHDTVIKRANASLKLSPMTFLHQMTRLILLEQIYRSFKILNNETYHK